MKQSRKLKRGNWPSCHFAVAHARGQKLYYLQMFTILSLANWSFEYVCVCCLFSIKPSYTHVNLIVWWTGDYANLCCSCWNNLEVKSCNEVILTKCHRFDGINLWTLNTVNQGSWSRSILLLKSHMKVKMAAKVMGVTWWWLR